MVFYYIVTHLLLLIALANSFPKPKSEDLFLSRYAANAESQPQFIPSKYPVFKRQSGYDTKTPDIDSVPQKSGGYDYTPPKLEASDSDTGAGSITKPDDYSGSGQNSGSGSVKCNRVGQGDTYRFVCEISRKEDVTLKYTHVLWLAGASANAPPIEITVPNYRVEEIIKAGFKSAGPGGKQSIKVLLQRPEKTVTAEAESQTATKIEPEVNVQYEPPTDTLVHYPNDQAYKPLSGPILPPARS